jgi:hypothetical protein
LIGGIGSVLFEGGYGHHILKTKTEHLGYFNGAVVLVALGVQTLRSNRLAGTFHDFPQSLQKKDSNFTHTTHSELQLAI